MNRPFNQSAQVISKPGFVNFDKSNVAGYMFTNLGAVNCWVNNMIVYPGTPGSVLGDSRSLSGHDGDFYIGDIVVKFDAGAGALVEIVILYYADKSSV